MLRSVLVIFFIFLLAETEENRLHEWYCTNNAIDRASSSLDTTYAERLTITNYLFVVLLMSNSFKDT